MLLHASEAAPAGSNQIQISQQAEQQRNRACEPCSKRKLHYNLFESRSGNGQDLVRRVLRALMNAAAEMPEGPASAGKPSHVESIIILQLSDLHGLKLSCLYTCNRSNKDVRLARDTCPTEIANRLPAYEQSHHESQESPAGRLTRLTRNGSATKRVLSCDAV